MSFFLCGRQCGKQINFNGDELVNQVLEKGTFGQKRKGIIKAEFDDQ